MIQLSQLTLVVRTLNVDDDNASCAF